MMVRREQKHDAPLQLRSSSARGRNSSNHLPAFACASA
jgi:hypothetical protein